MKRLNGREMKALFVLSIIVPISLLTALRFTGVLREPAALQTLNTTPLTWQIDRPRKFVNINDLVQKAFTNGEASIDVDLHVVGYYEDSLDALYQGRDGLEMTLFVNSTLKHGFSESFSVRLSPADNDSFVGVSGNQIINNVLIAGYKVLGTNSSEAFISATGTHSPAYLEVIAHWIFDDENTEDHTLRLNFEFTYQNATAAKQVVLPVYVTMSKDVGDTFEDSKQIQAGEYTGSLDSVDYIDMYNITIQNGQTIQINMTPPTDANYDLYLYNSNHETAAMSTKEQNATETITYTANATGTYFIQVIVIYWPGHTSEGAYILQAGFKE